MQNLQNDIHTFLKIYNINNLNVFVNNKKNPLKSENIKMSPEKL